MKRLLTEEERAGLVDEWERAEARGDAKQHKKLVERLRADEDFRRAGGGRALYLY